MLANAWGRHQIERPIPSSRLLIPSLGRRTAFRYRHRSQYTALGASKTRRMYASSPVVIRKIAFMLVAATVGMSVSGKFAVQKRHDLPMKTARLLTIEWNDGAKKTFINQWLAFLIRIVNECHVHDLSC